MRDEDECGDPLDELLRLSELARAIPGSRGSTTTYARSVTRFTVMNTAAISRLTPMIAGKSSVTAD